MQEEEGEGIGGRGGISLKQETGSCSVSSTVTGPVLGLPGLSFLVGNLGQCSEC